MKDRDVGYGIMLPPRYLGDPEWEDKLRSRCSMFLADDVEGARAHAEALGRPDAQIIRVEFTLMHKTGGKGADETQ